MVDGDSGGSGSRLSCCPGEGRERREKEGSQKAGTKWGGWLMGKREEDFEVGCKGFVPTRWSCFRVE